MVEGSTEKTEGEPQAGIRGFQVGIGILASVAALVVAVAEMLSNKLATQIAFGVSVLATIALFYLAISGGRPFTYVDARKRSAAWGLLAVALLAAAFLGFRAFAAGDSAANTAAQTQQQPAVRQPGAALPYVPPGQTPSGAPSPNVQPRPAPGGNMPYVPPGQVPNPPRPVAPQP